MKNSLLLIILFISSTLHAQIPCSFDSTFNSNGRLVADASRMGEHVVIQDDNKIVVACNPFGIGQSYLKRFLANGVVDNSFGTGGIFTLDMSANTDVADMLFKNNKFYICGNAGASTNNSPYIAVVKENGGYETQFGNSGYVFLPSNYYNASAITVDNNNNVYVAGNSALDELYIMKYNIAGVNQLTFGTFGIKTIATNNADHWFEVSDLIFDGESNFVLCGKKYKANNGSTITSFQNMMVIRFLYGGMVDQSFATNGIGLYNVNSTSFDEGKRIHWDQGNGYVVTGNSYNGSHFDYIATKLNSTGFVTSAFGNNGWSVIDIKNQGKDEYQLNSALLPDGRILMTGNEGSGDTVHFAMVMLKSDGSRDQSFAPNGYFGHIFFNNNNSSSSGMGFSSTGKIVLAGYTRTCTNGTCGPLSMAVARYNFSFGPNSVSINEKKPINIKVYPNPISSLREFSLLTDTKIERVEVYDHCGKKVKVFEKHGAKYQLITHNPGTYFVQVHTVLGVVNEKVIIQ